MAGTRRHAFNAHIYLDDTSAGTAAVGTATLTLISSKNEWDVSNVRDLVDVTSFGDTSKTRVAGLADATGNVKGFLDFGNVNMFNYVITSSTERGLMIFPDYVNNPTIYFSGKAFISATSGGSETGAVTFDLAFSAGPTGMSWTAS